MIQKKQPAYHTWTDSESFIEASQALLSPENHPIIRTKGSNIYQGYSPGNVSIRDGYNRSDYEYFRGDEAIPRSPKDIIRVCTEAADNIGILQNVLNSMSDYTIKGLDISHPNERIEKFHREWFRQINGWERSERFCNNLYKQANVFPRRLFGELNDDAVEQFRRAIADDGEDLIALPDKTPIGNRRIPLQYTFLNPMSLDLLSEDFASFLGPESFVFALRVPANLVGIVRNPKNDAERAVVAKIPNALRRQIAEGGSIILDSKSVSAYYYKRDDWKAWAKPISYAILSDLNLLQKMKLADLSALDGAISCIRVWKLGSIEHKIMPSEATIQRLAQMLCNNVGGGVMDLIWGPDIDLIETATDVHLFLGDTKYAPTLDAIFQGLGFPIGLTGGKDAAGMTNNAFSLKAFIERLEYGRGVLKQFWDTELRIVQRAMGFRFPAVVSFDNVLTDDAAEKKLVIDLVDRNIISEESAREIFGYDPDIETYRMRRQERKRAAKQIPEKAGPYHNADFEQGIKKIFAQSGAYTPAEFGIEMEPKAGKSPAEIQAKLAPKPAPGTPTSSKPKGTPGEGRPKNAKDSQKRKQKVVKPRSTKAQAEFVNQLAWAENAYATISRYFSPAYLSSLGKKTLRELTDQEGRGLEDFKFAVLCEFDIGADVTEEAMKAALGKKLTIPPAIEKVLQATVAQWVSKHSKEPSLDILRKLRANAYVLFKGNFSEPGVGE